jgi:hypothetical protein
MSCTRCLSLHQTELNTELNLHFRGLTFIGDPGILMFPKVLVCLDCGLAQFVVAERELSQIVERNEKRHVSSVKAKPKLRQIGRPN